jgi:lipoyl-dependent peroxiredoxin
VSGEGRGSTASSVQYTLRCSAGIEFSAFKSDERILESGAVEIFNEPVSSASRNQHRYDSESTKHDSEFGRINFQSKEEQKMQRKASAVWQGDLKSGKGTISTDSGTLKQTQYSFSTRFENGVGTNPEELLAAAHAGCFTMALSGQLGAVGLKADKMETTATISLEKVGEGFSITKSHLDLVAKVPGADQAKFDQAVKNAETGCPVSKLFKAEITVNARLES